MASGGDGGGGGGGEKVVEMEEAVKLLVEHLVRPVVPRGALQNGNALALAPEKKAAVARQIHIAVIMYNYYHRKLSPQLAFAYPKRFFTSLTVGDADSNAVHESDKSSRDGMHLNLTDKAAIDACEIAEALDASKESPDMAMWPISKVALLLVDSTRKNCLLEEGFVTNGVRSIMEKEIDMSDNNEQSSNPLKGRGAKHTAAPHVLGGPYAIQEAAFSELERRAGTTRSNFPLLDEDLTYSLTKKRTTTKIFIVQYEKAVKDGFVEVPIKDLISRMSGPVVINDPYPTTTPVVDYYHILPYKDVLFDCLHRKQPSDSSSVPKEQTQNGKCSKGKKAKIKPVIKKTTIKGPIQKKNKEVKAASSNEKINCGTSKNIENNNMKRKRKYEVLSATTAESTEGCDGLRTTIQNELPSVAHVENMKLVTNSVDAKETAVTRGCGVHTEAGVGMDNNRTEQCSVRKGISQFPEKALGVDPVMNNGTLENQNAKASEKPGGITEGRNDQMHASLQSLLKIRDDLLRKQYIIEDRSAQYDMDLQTIFSEGEMTPKVLSILQKYEIGVSDADVVEVANSSRSTEECQTMKIKWKKLTPASFLRNKCQELDEICRSHNWILPRYEVTASLTDGMFQASVSLACLELNMNGTLQITPREARESAAAHMIYELFKKAEKTSRTPDATLPHQTLGNGSQQVAGKNCHCNFTTQH